jgi:3-hydroxyacyl-CoA dehydrogenase
MYVFKAAVVGAGTMGGDIAHAVASAGIPVVLKDVDPGAVERGIAKARSLWQAQVDAGKLTAAESERHLGLIAPTTDYEGFGDVDFVIEAVPERMEVKQAVFSELDDVTPGQAILASNTSSLSITEIGEVTTRPDKVVGFHFFFPASVNRLVEVIEGDDTSTETAQAAANFAQAIRKLPIRVADVPGFVVNRIMNAAVSELWRAQEQEGIEIEELDRVVGESATSGRGPFYVADLIGLDTVLAVSEHLHDCYGDRFHVPARLRELVQAGDLGAKTGRGFYDHRS